MTAHTDPKQQPVYRISVSPKLHDYNPLYNRHTDTIYVCAHVENRAVAKVRVVWYDDEPEPHVIPHALRNPEHIAGLIEALARSQDVVKTEAAMLILHRAVLDDEDDDGPSSRYCYAEDEGGAS